jgi:hypothetical protein
VAKVGVGWQLELLADLRRLIGRPRHSDTVMRAAAEAHGDPFASDNWRWSFGGSDPFLALDLSQLEPVEGSASDQSQAPA